MLERRCFIFLILIIFINAILLAQEKNITVYREIKGKSVVFNKCIINSEGNGYRIEYATQINDIVQDSMEIYTDRNYSTIEWKYISINVNISAIRIANCIRLKGVFNNKPIDKEYHIDSSPWKQLFPYDIGKSLPIDEKELSFWSISPKKLDITQFSIKIESIAPIKIGDKYIESFFCRLRMKGIFSSLWNAKTWFEKDDISFLKYEGVNGPPGTAVTIIEKIE